MCSFAFPNANLTPSWKLQLRVKKAWAFLSTGKERWLLWHNRNASCFCIKVISLPL
jgi:hypothetical protein